MAYSKDIALKVRKIIDERREAAISGAEKRRSELHERFPEIQRIDDELAKTWIYIMEETSKGGDDLQDRIAEIKAENHRLRRQRGTILRINGFPEDYSDIKYSCQLCSDTGFDGEKMCSCMKKLLTIEGLRRAGISRLFETQRFDTFSLAYYSYDERAYQNMREVLAICREYADNFDEYTVENLLFCGNTGLGKTHLSTAIAEQVIEKGFDVCYNSAQNIIAEFEAERFNRNYAEKDPAALEKYFNCDLLIIDDLGTENSTQYTVGCIYNIINSRVVSGKPMIINTNLTHDEMRKRYTDRVASRLFGEFTVLLFVGKDIRFLKLED